MSSHSRRATDVVLVLGGLLGLFIRYPMLFYMGVFDMAAYFEWGKRALEMGLARSYHGIYFPIQYQAFEACALMVTRFGGEFFTTFKVFNLIFDAGTFCLLVFLLKRQRSNPLYALIYWFHPWFLTVFSLGYIDFHFTFFVLLSIWLLRGDTVWNYLVAGIPLGCAFLMKPQAQILVVATFFFGCFGWLRSRDPRPLAMLGGSFVLFVAYEIVFLLSLPAPSHAAALILPLSYLNVTNIMPVLTAQMTNIWCPIAYLIKQPDQPIIAVSDQIQLLPHLSARYFAAGTVLALIGIHVYRVGREPEVSPSDKFVTIFGLASLIVPFFMTSAHENHLFLGTVFMVLISACRAPLSLKLAVQVLLLVQFFNIFSLYSEHPQWLAVLLRQTPSDELAVVYSIVSLVCFGLVATRLWNWPGKVVSAPDSPGNACS